MALFAVMLGRLTRDAIADTQPVGKIGWTYCAIGALAITGLNPTFVPKIVFTAYADTPTMVLVGMLSVMMWMMLNALPTARKGTRQMHWHGVSVSSRWLLRARNNPTSFCAV